MGIPELALTFREVPKPPVLSFFDSPGFLMPPQGTTGVDPDATKVCLVQCFHTWVVVRSKFTKGVFQASPAFRWSNLMCVARPDASSAQWRISSSALLSGYLDTNRPLCDRAAAD